MALDWVIGHGICRSGWASANAADLCAGFICGSASAMTIPSRRAGKVCAINSSQQFLNGGLLVITGNMIETEGMIFYFFLPEMAERPVVSEAA